MSGLRLYLLGPPQIEVDDQPVEIPRRKAIGLVSHLAVNDEMSQQRDGLATLFWPAYDQRRARAALRSALWVLNKSPLSAWLLIEPETVSLRLEPDPATQSDPLWLDVTHFRQLLAIAQNHDHPPDEVCPACLSWLTEAVSLYRDDFLAGFTLPDAPDFDEWQFFQTESLRQDLASAFERLIGLQSAQGDFESAIPYARRHLALDPLHEPAHQQLMRLYAQSGQQAAALRQYQVCLETLEVEFGIVPAEETTALYERIRSGASDQKEEAYDSRRDVTPVPPARQPPAPRPSQIVHNLPPEPAPFIGREAELAAIDDFIADPAVRLVTILGPGGIGKTRLALVVAERQLTQSHFSNGIYFVSLAPLSETEAIIPAIAEAVAYPFQSDGRSPHQQLLNYFRQKTALLLLDNFEHLIDGVEFITDLLRECPRVKILATSRERLHLHEERVYPLQGLAFPKEESINVTSGDDDIATYAAVKLFQQSARHVQPDFAVAPEDSAPLTDICRLLDGMPLGLELAATWVNMLSVADIVTEIRQNLDFLETEMRNIPDLHRSIRAVFDTSWQRLNQAEQKVFAQLSIFRGGFTREAVKDITGASLRTLATLVNKSLLRYRRNQDRYEIHELLHQYVAEKLAKDPAQEIAICDRRCAFYCARLGRREADLKGPHRQEALAEIEPDLENARLAWQWAVEQQQVEHLGQALVSLGLFYLWRGRLHSGEAMCRLAIDRLEPAIHGRFRPMCA